MSQYSDFANFPYWPRKREDVLPGPPSPLRGNAMDRLAGKTVCIAGTVKELFTKSTIGPPGEHSSTEQWKDRPHDGRLS